MGIRLESLGNTETRWEQWERVELDPPGSQKIYLSSSSGPSGIIRSALQVFIFCFSTIRIIIHFPVISHCFFQYGKPLGSDGTTGLGWVVKSVEHVILYPFGIPKGVGVCLLKIY